MKRQLRMGGGIMDIVPREPAILGGIKKAVKKTVKKVTGGLKDIISSDAGKLALAGAALYGFGGSKFLGGEGIFKAGQGLQRFSNLANLPSAISGLFPESATTLFDPDDVVLASKKAAGDVSKSFLGGNVGKLATLGVVSAFLTKTLGMPPEQAEAELARDPSTYLEQYYRNVNPPTADTNSEQYEAEVRDFVARNTSEYAVGGRVGFENGSDDSAYMQDFSFSGQEKAEEFLRILEDARKAEEERRRDKIQEMYRQFMLRTQPMEVAEGGRIGFAEGPVLPPDPTQPVNPFGPKPGDFGIEEDISIKMAGYGYDDAMSDTFDMFQEMKRKGLIPPTMEFDEFLQEVVPEMNSKRIEETRGLAALGGKMDTASDNAMQAAGIEGLPIRQNPKGVKELDLRKTGGFIPPVGIKEKEDDIPAMLSNNEFVFTADAVRGMGQGDVNKGAERMYNMMKTLEAGGRV